MKDFVQYVESNRPELVSKINSINHSMFEAATIDDDVLADLGKPKKTQTIGDMTYRFYVLSSDSKKIGNAMEVDPVSKGDLVVTVVRGDGKERLIAIASPKSGQVYGDRKRLYSNKTPLDTNKLSSKVSPIFHQLVAFADGEYLK